jgi:hypothetical protein
LPTKKKKSMKALVYYGPGGKPWEEQPELVLKETRDAIG